MSTNQDRLRIGCCGFRRARAPYFETFKVVEVQHTFYDPPQFETLRKWREEAPEGFEFTMKAWQLITHEAASPTYKRLKKALSADEWAGCGSFRPSDAVKRGLDVTLACAEALNAKKVLFQCPPRFKPEEENLEHMRWFFSLPRPAGMEYLWEPRGGWPEALIRTMCDECRLTHVVNPFKESPVTSGLYYFRLHGRQGQQHYDAAALRVLEETVREIDGPVYVLFNNVRMLEDAEAFQERMTKRRASSREAASSL